MPIEPFGPVKTQKPNYPKNYFVSKQMKITRLLSMAKEESKEYCVEMCRVSFCIFWLSLNLWCLVSILFFCKLMENGLSEVLPLPAGSKNDGECYADCLII